MSAKHFIALLAGIAVAVSAGIWYQSTQTVAIGGVAGSNSQNVLWKLSGGNLLPSLASWGITVPSLSSSGDCIVTDASGNLSTSACGSGGASDWNDSGSFLYPKEGDYVQAPYFISTSTTVFNRFLNIGTSYLRASSSAGIIVEANNGSDVADFGAGGGTNATFYGGVNIDGQTRVATSITGLLQGVAGVVSATTTGTFTETVTGLELSGTRSLVGGAAILSITSGYGIPTTAKQTEWDAAYTVSHAAVTLSGALDYITLVGQDIVRGAIDLATDVTGALGIANGGLGAAFTDPNADQLMFWDDSAAKITGIASLVGAAISGTTLTINDVTCTDCLTSTEIADEYLFNTGDVGTGVFDFGGATSLEIVNGAAPTVDATGECAWDTTDDQLKCADGGNTARVVAHDEFRVVSITVASTSLAFTSGQTLAVLSHKDGLEITQYRCYVVGGTSKVVNLTDGTNDTETITCATTITSDTDVATNDTFTADELGYLEFGASSGSPNYLHFEAWGRITGE